MKVITRSVCYSHHVYSTCSHRTLQFVPKSPISSDSVRHQLHQCQSTSSTASRRASPRLAKKEETITINHQISLPLLHHHHRHFPHVRSLALVVDQLTMKTPNSTISIMPKMCRRAPLRSAAHDVNALNNRVCAGAAPRIPIDHGPCVHRPLIKTLEPTLRKISKPDQVETLFLILISSLAASELGPFRGQLGQARAN